MLQLSEPAQRESWPRGLLHVKEHALYCLRRKRTREESPVLKESSPRFWKMRKSHPTHSSLLTTSAGQFSMPQTKRWLGAFLDRSSDRDRLRWDRVYISASVLPEEEIPGHSGVSICHDKLSS